MGLPNIGPMEMIIILVIAVLVLGPSKLPEVGSAFGKTIREFKKAVDDVKEPLTSAVKSPVAVTSVATTPAPAPDGQDA